MSDVSCDSKEIEVADLQAQLQSESREWLSLVELLSLRLQQLEKVGANNTPAPSVADEALESAKFVPNHMQGAFAMRRPAYVIDMREDELPSFVQQSRGLSAKEHWGRWTDSDICRIYLLEPLFGRVSIKIICYSSVFNGDEIVVVVFGGRVVAFKPKSDRMSAYQFEIDMRFGSRVLEIYLPNAFSPRHWFSDEMKDKRRLGLAVQSIIIAPIDQMP